MSRQEAPEDDGVIILNSRMGGTMVGRMEPREALDLSSCSSKKEVRDCPECLQINCDASRFNIDLYFKDKTIFWNKFPRTKYCIPLGIPRHIFKRHFQYK